MRDLRAPAGLQRPITPAALTGQAAPESKEGQTHSNEHSVTDSESDDEAVHKDAQVGVQKIEATAQVWTKSTLITVYIMIWFIYFINATEQGMTGNLTPYVTSSFQLHSLTAATSIMSSIIGGLFKLPLAKIIDVWGRPQGFLAMTACLTLGLVMMAACNDVQIYAAAQVLYWLGYNGQGYVMGIVVADTSSLRNRGFMFAFISSPYIATVWITGPLATAFLNGPGFRWAFGAFAIITPVISLPLYILLQWNYRKAVKAGVMPQHDSGRTVPQSIKYYAIEYDVFGLLLICGGLALFLLPFSLYSYQARGWQSPMIICMIVFGALLLIAFGLWEAYLAPVTFMPWALLADRTVLGANILAAVLFFEFYIWNSYFTSFLQVAMGLSITQSSYIANIYSIGACFWALICGALIRWHGKFKAQSLYFGVPITILGVGLMIHFRQPDQNIGFIIMCQIFIAFGGGTLVICEQLAAMAATSHQYVAVVLAVEGMFSSVGGAIGSTVAAAIWTGTFLPNLYKYLPADEQVNATTIYGDLVTQLSYAKGTEARAGIDRAYGETQKIMCVAATAALVLAIAGVMMWRDINVKHNKQGKGLVF
ncbi:MFS siderochrome iron transporter 1 [Oleoguttula sp. CCFEE 5521]